MNKWEKFSDWRKCSIDISGKEYSTKYARSRGWLNEKYVKCPNDHTFVFQRVEVTLDNNNTVLCRLVENGVNSKKKREFVTSKGVFVSHNRGEFGGELILPNGGDMDGNFDEVFEIGESIYAISSFAFMFEIYVKIHKFSSDLDIEKTQIIYESKDNFSINTKVEEHIDFKALFMTDNSAYILVSGYISDEISCTTKTISHLFRITENELEKTTFNHNFEGINNMVITDTKMILGMDKVVAIVDLETKEIVAYTPISENDEKDLMQSKK